MADPNVISRYTNPGQMPNLDPALLQQLRGAYQPGQMSTYNGWTIEPQYGWQGGDGGTPTQTPGFKRAATDASGQPLLDAQGRPTYDLYDQSGQWQERGGDSNSWTSKDWLLAAAALAGGAWAGGAFGGAGAAGAGAGTATADQLGMMGLGTQGMGGATAAGAAGAAGAGGTSGLGSLFNLGGAGAAGAGGSSVWGPLIQAGLAYAMRPDLPATPDYNSIAAQQGQQNLYAAMVQNQMNRVNTTTPYGSQTFQTIADPSVPGGYRYSSNISLSPEQQQLYDLTTQGQTRTAQIGNDQLGRIGQNFSSPFDLGAYGQSQRAGTASAFRDANGNVGFQQARQTVGQGPSFQGAAQGPSFQNLDPTQKQSYGAFELAPKDGGPQFSQMGSSLDLSRFGAQGPQARDLYGAQGYEGSRQKVENSVMERFNRMREPQMAQDTAALESKLKNMGLAEGTEAYDREMKNLRDQQAQERANISAQAVQMGGQEQSRLAGLDLSADAQRFGQQQQGWSNLLTGTGFNNDATGKEYSAELGRLGFNNTQGQQSYSNLLGALTQRNNATGLNNDWARTGANDFFGQNKDVATFNNQTGQQSWQNEQAGRQFGNTWGQQGFTNQVTAANTNNQAYDAEYRRYLDAMAYQENTDRTNAGFNNTQRQNEINNGLMMRNLPLTEYNALRSGTQPTLPQFQPFGMGSVQPVNYMQAGQNQAQANANTYNARMGQYQQLVNLAGQVPWGQLFNFGGGGGQPGGYTPDALSYFYGG